LILQARTIWNIPRPSRCSDHDILHGAPANYRFAMKESFFVGDDGHQSMYDQCFTGRPNVFGTNSMIVLPFQEESVDSDVMNLYDDCRLLSFSKENLWIGETLVKEVKVKFDSIAVVPTETWVKMVAFILNRKIAPFGNTEWNGKQHDFSSILTSLNDIHPSSNEDLLKFIALVDWPFFRIEGYSFNVNMWRIRSFFQALHPVGLSFVEGNHRAVLASSVLYGGMDLSKPFPLDFDFDIQTKRITDRSPLLNLIDIKICSPLGTPEGDMKVISHAMLESCRNASKEVAANKSLVVQDTWKTFLQDVISKITNHKMFKPVTVSEYLLIVMPTTKREDNLNPLLNRQIPFVDMSYFAMDVLGKCFVETEPAASLTRSAKLKNDFFEKYLTDVKRIALGQLTFYMRTTPDADKNYEPIALKKYQQFELWKDGLMVRGPTACSAYAELIKRVGILKEGFEIQ
jgi:hypothetical protein